MKPPPFSYADPRSVPEALEVLRQHGDDCKVLAGGQSLVPLLNMRLAQPSVLIDVNHLHELDYVTSRSRGGTEGLAIGAVTRQRTVETESGLTDRFPLLKEAIRWVGHQQIRNRGTVGGSIAHADPSAELPVVFLALDGMAAARSSRGERFIPASDFFVYTFTPALEPDELLTEVWMPTPPPRTGHAFVEVARRHGDFALVAVAASVTLDEQGICSEVRLAIGGAAPVPARLSGAEAVLRGRRPSEALFRLAADAASSEVDPTGDVHADADYRRDVAGVLAARALQIASERAPNTGGDGRYE